MWTRRGATTFGIAALLLTGCSSEAPTGTSGNTDGGPVAVSSSIQSLVDALCGMARTCCGRSGYPAEPLADCESAVIRQIDPLQEAINGTVAIDTTRFAGCVEQYRAAAASCSYPPSVEDACSGIFSGTKGAGERCSSSEECIRGAVPVACLLPMLDGGAASTGVCHDLKRGAAGEACIISGGEHLHGTTYSTTDPNPSLVYCDSADHLYCSVTRTCAPFVPVGSACQTTQECGPDAYCDVTCLARKPAGSPCSGVHDCQGAQSCNSGVCGPLAVANDKTCGGDFN